MHRNATKLAAEKLCLQFGAGARERALIEAHEARRKHNERLAKFYQHVARRITIDAEKADRAGETEKPPEQLSHS